MYSYRIIKTLMTRTNISLESDGNHLEGNNYPLYIITSRAVILNLGDLPEKV